MSFRKATILAGFFLAAALSLSQSGMVATTVQAVTSPVTTPVSYFTYLIKGKLTYRFLNLLPMPARDVVVTARNLASDPAFSAKTGINGSYTIEVKQSSPSATYSIKVMPKGKEAVIWSPSEYKRAISKDTYNIDFIGTYLRK